MEQKSEWQNQGLAEAFLEGVRGAIPGADLQLSVIGKIQIRMDIKNLTKLYMHY